MSRREVEVYRVCDMPHSREARATHQDVRFALNGAAYRMDLCDVHDATLAAQLLAFAEHAVQTAKPSQIFDRPRAAIPTTVVVTPRPAAAPVQAEQRRQAAMAREPLPATAERWTLTEHALERMNERGLDLYEVLMTAERPEHVTPRTTVHPGQTRDARAEERYRSDVKLIVRPSTLEVLTVARQIEQWDDGIVVVPPRTTQKASA